MRSHLDPARFADWLECEVTRDGRRPEDVLGPSAPRAFYRWRREMSGPLPFVNADKWLVRAGLHEVDVPDDVWYSPSVLTDPFTGLRPAGPGVWERVAA